MYVHPALNSRAINFQNSQTLHRSSISQESKCLFMGRLVACTPHCLMFAFPTKFLPINCVYKQCTRRLTSWCYASAQECFQVKHNHVECNVFDDESSMSVKKATSHWAPLIFPYGLTKGKPSSSGTEILLENTYLIHPMVSSGFVIVSILPCALILPHFSFKCINI